MSDSVEQVEEIVTLALLIALVGAVAYGGFKVFEYFNGNGAPNGAPVAGSNYLPGNGKGGDAGAPGSQGWGLARSMRGNTLDKSLIDRSLWPFGWLFNALFGDSYNNPVPTPDAAVQDPADSVSQGTGGSGFSTDLIPSQEVTDAWTV